MLGCRSCDWISISRRSWFSTLDRVSSALWSTLSATKNFDFFSRHGYTLPNLPLRSFLLMSKSNRFTGAARARVWARHRAAARAVPGERLPRALGLRRGALHQVVRPQQVACVCVASSCSALARRLCMRCVQRVYAVPRLATRSPCRTRQHGAA